MIRHFAFYEVLPRATGLRSLVVKLERRLIRRVMRPVFRAQEVRFQKIYDAMQDLRAEHRRLDGHACMRLAVHRRLDFLEKAIASLQSPKAEDHGLRSNHSGPQRARCA